MTQVIEDRIERDPNTGCWLWIGPVWTSSQGEIRGNAYFRKVRMQAHRFSYIAFNGPIPDGLFVCHTCDIGLCVNPSHLFLGTAQDNSDDARAKGRMARNIGPAHRLTAKEKKQLLTTCLSAPLQALAKKFGVCPATITVYRRKARTLTSNSPHRVFNQIED